MKFKKIRKDLILFIFCLITFSYCKSFIDIAQEEVFNKDEYLSTGYRKEAASLNPEYYTPKGQEELDKCRNIYKANYDRCSSFSTCNLCSANSDCGWCNEKKICLPIELNSRSDGLVPICQGDCIRVLKIEYCFKGLFEPENTKAEINFANYMDVNEGNIFEKTLEKNINNQNDHPLDGMTPDHVKINSSNLNFLPNENTNKPLSLNMDSHHQRLYDDLKNISKDVFKKLIGEKVNTKTSNENLLMKYDPPTSQEEMMNYLKEYIPNYEFPQFVKSDLEGSIDQIKKEKLLLWLRGYSLNEPISKQHLPIYKNINFINEDQVRKSYLDKFYNNIVKDPYSKINSLVYKNLIGEKTLFGNNVRSNYKDVKNNYIVNSKFIDSKDIKSLIKRNNMRFKEADSDLQNKKLINNTQLNKDQSKEKSVIKKHKTFKQISQQFKDFLNINK